MPDRHDDEDVLADARQGTLDLSPIFDKTVDVDGVPEGYRATDEREAVKSLIEL